MSTDLLIAIAFGAIFIVPTIGVVIYGELVNHRAFNDIYSIPKQIKKQRERWNRM